MVARCAMGNLLKCGGHPAEVALLHPSVPVPLSRVKCGTRPSPIGSSTYPKTPLRVPLPGAADPLTHAGESYNT